MIYLYGVYNLGHKRNACRNDYCTVCRGPTFTEGYRTFKIFHFWYIPLLPLGFHRQWVCRTCGQDPQKKRVGRPGILIAGMFAAGLVMFIGTMVTLTEKNSGAWPLIPVGAAVIAALGFALKQQNRRGDNEVPALTLERCPYCEEKLPATPDPTCPCCQVRVFT